MKAAGIQSKIYAGYAKAAARLGYDVQLYRATGPFNAMSDANFQGTLPASFNAEDMGYKRPNKYGHPTWYVLADGRQLQVGDMLRNDQDGTFFIAAMQPQLPILVVEANVVASVLRATESDSVGAVGYSGATAANEVPLMTNWPASVLQGGRGEKNDVDLPSDTRAALWGVLMPATSGVILRSSDILVDQFGRRYALLSCELTGAGWRLTARQELA
jgi:hypothetical protein